ncbi:MAG: HD domain-containing protein [Bulleidia sp.]|nr:HD domain-containing protein [Bulleidia sp.]
MSFQYYIARDQKNALVCIWTEGEMKRLDYATGLWEDMKEQQDTSEWNRITMHDAGEILKADQMAAAAHAHQKDKAGKPYILHPVRVVERLEIEKDDIWTVQKICTALLHDTVEDTDTTLEELESFLDTNAWHAVALMTHGDDVVYLDYVRNLSSNPIARAVKKSDLKDNMDISRIPQPKQKDYDRIKVKYEPALKIIEEAEKKIAE